MILLTATNHSLQLITSTSQAVDWVSSYVDMGASSFAPDSAQGTLSAATTTTVVAAPAASTQRQVKMLTVANRGTATQVVQLVKTVGGSSYELTPPISLKPDEALHYVEGVGFTTFLSSGAQKVANNPTTIGSQSTSLMKVGTAAEAAGQFYCWAKDSGAPGAWAPGTPGLNGRTCDGTTSTDAGCIPVKSSVSGDNYLDQFAVATTVATFIQLFDFLWVNSGLAVTTTTAQSITTPTLPARDLNDSSNGQGVVAAILVTTATTNGSAVTNTTMSYTNQDGTSGRTATIASFPATGVAGTVVFFQLQAGDTGIRSIQSVTLGTSYGGGAISLVLLRPIVGQSCASANAGGPPLNVVTPGPKLPAGVCLHPIGLMSANSATTLVGNLVISER